jgi:hypothetical protein
MTKLKFLGAALMLAALLAAPTLTQADEYVRHHRHRHNVIVTTIPITTTLPGSAIFIITARVRTQARLPITMARPRSAANRAPPPIAARMVEGIRVCEARLGHCEPTGRANARPMTGSAKQSRGQARLDSFVRYALRNDGGASLDRNPHFLDHPRVFGELIAGQRPQFFRRAAAHGEAEVLEL